jgi:transketolase
MATGSEVALIVEAGAVLAREGIKASLVSLPCWRLFDEQGASYRDAVLPPGVTARVAIEAASPFGWERYVGPRGRIIGIDRFGASAPGPTLMTELGITAARVVEAARLAVGAGASAGVPER